MQYLMQNIIYLIQQNLLQIYYLIFIIITKYFNIIIIYNNFCLYTMYIIEYSIHYTSKDAR